MIAAGVSSLIRAAASSIASGRPSSRCTIRVIAAALSSSMMKCGATAAARAANRRIDSQSTTSLGTVSTPGSGTRRGATGNSCSPEMRSGARLVITIRSSIVSPSRPATIDPASGSCSKLSRTRRTLRSRRKPARCSNKGMSRESCSPSCWAIDDGTSAASRIAASATKCTPSGNSSTTMVANSIASRVLPLPPGPVSVSSRLPASNRRSSVSSCSRPTKLVSGRCRVCRTVPVGRRLLSSVPTAPVGAIISCRASSARRRARRRLPTQTNVSSGLRNHTDVRTALDF